ncbi:MAG: molybdopterin molybdotransferase MoeA [Candidatus Rokuibacteriota bacterium]
MISVEEALDRILSRVTVLGDERVALVDALHRVLAEDVDSPRDMPPWPASSMDGYALRSADVAAASAAAPARLTVAARIAAGATAERALRSGEAFRIFTGAPLPEGADSVVPQENVSEEGGTLLVSGRVAAGAFVRPRAEDMKRGDRVLARGRVLSAADVGLLATVGRAMVSVIRRPRIGVLSTGDELVDLGGQIGPGQIPNSNSYSLIAQVVEAGAQPVSLGIARDRLDDIEARLRWGLGCELLMSSAGVSVGEHDHVKGALGRLGAEQHLWLVDMRPGKPIAFATIPQDGKSALPVFALPGNPVSAMVTFELFVRPAILRMAGHARLHRPTINARALAPIGNRDRRRGYLRVTLTPDGESYGARLTGTQSSGVLRSMVAADGLAVVPGDTTIQPGDPVNVILLRPGL